MMETEDYKKAQAKLEAEEAEGKKHKVGFIPMVKGYWKTLLLGCGTRWVDGTFYNIFIVWILSYCIKLAWNATDPDLYYYDYSMYF